ncbi:MAG: hypothetical protein IPM82_27690 [Saprospiraceae bacterium]|nr:hypothetical protein [Saprospiraceae bacterium]
METIQFDIMHNGSSVGEFIASKTTEGERTTFVNATDIKTKIIRDIRVYFNIQSTFKDNELEYSSVEILVNGKSYSQSTTKKVGDKYHFYKDGKLKTILSGPIKYSAAMMIFSEPTGFTTAYSEESGGFHDIAKAVANVYEKRNSRGRKSIYHYKNQALKSMDVDIGLTKIEMVLKD